METRVTDQPVVDAVATLVDTIEAHDGDTLCFLAGGSAFELYEHITLSVAAKRRTIFCMGDERVSGEPEENNYLQLRSRCPNFVAEHTIIDTSVHASEHGVEFADRISELIDKKISAATDLQIISLQGLGTDGHTAGIFPMDEDSFRKTYVVDHTYVPVVVKGLTIDSRASLRPAFIVERVNTLIVYGVGTNKRAKLEELLIEEKPLHEMPIQLAKHHQHAVLITDQNLTV